MATDPMTGKKLSNTDLALHQIHGELVKIAQSLALLVKSVETLAQRTPR